MTGFQVDFLDPNDAALHTPMPKRLSGGFRDRMSDLNAEPPLAHHPDFSILMNRELRTAAVAAINVDRASIHKVDKTEDWDFDDQIDADFQLGNDYYKRIDAERDNLFDRGHLVPDATAGWGPRESALTRTNATYVYTNSTLQQANLNRDEWRALEEWARVANQDDHERMNMFIGPIHAPIALAVRPDGHPTAMAPAGYFKILAFKHADQRRFPGLSVRAFIIPQGVETIRDQKGWRPKRLERYQVSVMQIEDLTGLKFDAAIKDANPLFFKDGDSVRAEDIPGYPEMRLVTLDHDIIDAARDARGDDAREKIVREEVKGTSKIFFAAALVNPAGGGEAGREWVSVINLGSSPADLDGWVMRNQSGDETVIAGVGALDPGACATVRLRLPNRAGEVALLRPRTDTKGKRVLTTVDKVRLDATEVKTDGLVIPLLSKRLS